MAADDFICYDTLKTSYSTQSTGWVASSDSPVGWDAYIFFTQGAKVELRAYVWIVDENKISLDIWGTTGLNGHGTDGYQRLTCSGDWHLLGIGDWNTVTWYKDFLEDGTLKNSSSAVGDADFWCCSPANYHGDDRDFRITVASSHGYDATTWNSIIAKKGDTIKGRGWFTDRWWGIAKLDINYTGIQGLPISSSNTMPIFTTVRQALAYAESWAGTYITDANKAACFPSTQEFRV